MTPKEEQELLHKKSMILSEMCEKNRSIWIWRGILLLCALGFIACCMLLDNIAIIFGSALPAFIAYMILAVRKDDCVVSAFSLMNVLEKLGELNEQN